MSRIIRMRNLKLGLRLRRRNFCFQILGLHLEFFCVAIYNGLKSKVGLAVAAGSDERRTPSGPRYPGSSAVIRSSWRRHATLQFE